MYWLVGLEVSVEMGMNPDKDDIIYGKINQKPFEALLPWQWHLCKAGFQPMSGKFTDFQISIVCHLIVSTKFSFEFHEFRIKNHLCKYAFVVEKQFNKDASKKKNTYHRVPKLFA